MYRLITTFFLSLLLAGCQQQKAQEQPDSIPVKVSRIEYTSLEQSIDYVGSIKAQDEATIYPKVSGKIIEKAKEDGSPVEKGEAVAYIDRDEVGLRFERAPVETPLTGVIGRVYVDMGEKVTTQTPIALVVNMDKVKTNLDIPEKYLPRISVGQEARITVDAYPKKDFKGSVTKVSPVLDQATRTAPVEIVVDNTEHLLKSGMFAKVSLVIDERKNIPVVMKEAIVGKDSQVYVYVIENKKAVLKKIKLGIRQGPYFEVTEGLKDGDLVVIIGQQRLYEGAPVSVEE